MTGETEVELVVAADGAARCIHDEALDLPELGELQITRASHVEPDAEGYWWAAMGPSGGPVLGPYGSRTEALRAEREWLWRRPIQRCLAVGTRRLGETLGKEEGSTSRDAVHRLPKTHSLVQLASPLIVFLHLQCHLHTTSFARRRFDCLEQRSPDPVASVLGENCKIVNVDERPCRKRGEPQETRRDSNGHSIDVRKEHERRRV